MFYILFRGPCQAFVANACKDCDDICQGGQNYSAGITDLTYDASTNSVTVDVEGIYDMFGNLLTTEDTKEVQQWLINEVKEKVPIIRDLKINLKVQSSS